MTQVIKAHFRVVASLDFSPDGTVLATGSLDETTKLWNTQTWLMQGNTIHCCGTVCCNRYSPSGEILAIATDRNIQIYDAGTVHCIANLAGRTSYAYNFFLAWTLDSTRLLSGASESDPSIWEWDTSTWKVSDSWIGHTSAVFAIAIHPAGALVASASGNNNVRLWRLSDRQTIAIFQSSNDAMCVTFSKDGKHIISGDRDNKISEWAVPEDALLDDSLKSKFKARVQRSLRSLRACAVHASRETCPPLKSCSRKRSVPMSIITPPMQTVHLLWHANSTGITLFKMQSSPLASSPRY